MDFPILFVNFKTYEKGTGKSAVRLARICKDVRKNTGKNIIPVVQIGDLYRISKEVEVPIFAQHIDPIEYGSHTGHILPRSLIKNGAKGVVINHSEDKRKVHTVKNCIESAKRVGLNTLVCAETPGKVKRFSSFNPDVIAIEPPELIGGDISVSSAKPSIITDSVENSSVPVICGAGIKSKKDVEKALKLGSKGIFVASGIVKAENPEEKIKELSNPL